MRVLVLLSLIGLSLCMRDQSVAIKGKLMCGSKPAAKVRVKLWEEDGGPDPDDLLAQGYTDANGEFKLEGGTAELTPIDPVFKVYHDCNDGIKPGSRKVKFIIPKSYITEGKMLYLLPFVLLIPTSLAMRNQAYAVHGRLFCGEKPAANVRVKLWEEDTGPDPDDLLDAGYTDAHGEFRLSGSTAELSRIDPIFKVYHDCDDGVKPGKRKVKFLLPKSYITDGKVAKKAFDIGILNLETRFPKEERQLIVSRRRRAHSQHKGESHRHYRALRNRRQGVNADYYDADRNREDDRIVPREREREGKNPCWP